VTGALEKVSGVRVGRIETSVHEFPVDGPDGRESDGTLEWKSTTIVVVEVEADGHTGLGYTYADASAAKLIESKLAPVAEGSDPFALEETWSRMSAELRNTGRPGLGFMALSAVDTALWDLRARLQDLPLVNALGRTSDRALIYGSGGFCNYPLERLQHELSGWVSSGIPRVKIKIGREPDRDPERLAAAREAIEPGTELYVDANGAFTPQKALDWAERYRAEWNVSWFEEPVSSDDLDGLRLVRERAPDGLDIAAGEYVFIEREAVELLDAVDCLQLDVTRCGGYTGFLELAGLAHVHGLDVSAHCAPQLSAHALCAIGNARHLEYFHDHVRIEAKLFDSVLEPEEGALRPDRSRPGHGLELRES
jgi:L-alanine-DL-glutamate epimerase-like enolase superfamily enzyme